MVKKIRMLKNLPAAMARIRLLVNKYKTHRIFKAFETFMFLKELTHSGKLQNTYGSTDAFMRFLAKHCSVSRNSMYARIEWMKGFKLIEIDSAGNILLESWTSIAKIFRVKKGAFQDIDLLPGSPRPEHTLRTLTISEHKKRMEFSFAKKINSNNQLRQTIETCLGQKADSITKLAALIQQAKILSFKSWSDSFDFWHSIPSDFNASVNRLKYYFAFDDFRQVAYWKRKLAKLGLINVQERKYESAKCTRKANDLLNGGKVQQTFFWDATKKMRVWQMPDAITINL
jgi:hypothetical protein